jgi:hypothetical protein
LIYVNLGKSFLIFDFDFTVIKLAFEGIEISNIQKSKMGATCESCTSANDDKTLIIDPSGISFLEPSEFYN